MFRFFNQDNYDFRHKMQTVANVLLEIIKLKLFLRIRIFVLPITS